MGDRERIQSHGNDADIGEKPPFPICNNRERGLHARSQSRIRVQKTQREEARHEREAGAQCQSHKNRHPRLPKRPQERTRCQPENLTQKCDVDGKRKLTLSMEPHAENQRLFHKFGIFWNRSQNFKKNFEARRLELWSNFFVETRFQCEETTEGIADLDLRQTFRKKSACIADDSSIDNPGTDAATRNITRSDADIRTLLDCANHHREKRGIVLQIRIHDGEDRPVRGIEPVDHCGTEALLTNATKNLDATAEFAELGCDFPRPIGRVVIDHDDLVGNMDEHAVEHLEKVCDIRRFVIGGKDEGKHGKQLKALGLKLKDDPATILSMKILVTGSSGTIGTRLCEMLLSRGDTVLGMDQVQCKWRPEAKKITTIVDMRDSAAMKKITLEADIIVHLAANARVYELVENPDLARDNFLTTFNALEFARKHGIKRFIFASSRESYGNTGIDKYTEDLVRVSNCESPYTASKIGGEALVEAYRRCYSIDQITFRFSNVYGMYDDSERVVPLFIRLARKNEAMTVFGKDKCLDFTYIDDTVAGIIAGIDQFESAKNDTYNLAYGEGTTILKLAEDIKKILGSSSKVSIGASRTGEVIRYIADISKAKKVLGYAPKTSFDEGVRKSVEWYLKHT